jgi:hypothetical protein
VKFVPITYKIHWTEKGVLAPREVQGFAFRIPGWPEFRCCVRFGDRFGDDLFADWIIDHYDTGLAISEAGRLKRMEAAPRKMKKVLDAIGKERVHKALLKQGISPSCENSDPSRSDIPQRSE